MSLRPPAAPRTAIINTLMIPEPDARDLPTPTMHNADLESILRVVVHELVETLAVVWNAIQGRMVEGDVHQIMKNHTTKCEFDYDAINPIRGCCTLARCSPYIHFDDSTSTFHFSLYIRLSPLSVHNDGGNGMRRIRHTR
jgi:hypothetical protein